MLPLLLLVILSGQPGPAPGPQSICGNGKVEPTWAYQCAPCQQSPVVCPPCPPRGPCAPCESQRPCPCAWGQQKIEECDGQDLAGETCRSRGYFGGALRCTSSCKLNYSECELARGGRLTALAVDGTYAQEGAMALNGHALLVAIPKHGLATEVGHVAVFLLDSRTLEPIAPVGDAAGGNPVMGVSAVPSGSGFLLAFNEAGASGSTTVVSVAGNGAIRKGGGRMGRLAFLVTSPAGALVGSGEYGHLRITRVAPDGSMPGSTAEIPADATLSSAAVLTGGEWLIAFRDTAESQRSVKLARVSLGGELLGIESTGLQGDIWGFVSGTEQPELVLTGPSSPGPDAGSSRVRIVRLSDATAKIWAVRGAAGALELWRTDRGAQLKSLVVGGVTGGVELIRSGWNTPGPVFFDGDASLVLLGGEHARLWRSSE